jgi:Putative addiction module component
MASKVDEREAAALHLPLPERAQLVSGLVASLDQQVDEELELAWVEEAERWHHEPAADSSLAEPAPTAFQRARDALR